MADTPTIAVIVPNFNDARYLPRCLRSVLEQEAPPDELLVVDDASSDNSIATIRSLIEGSPRARLHANPVNLGTNRTINESLERVESEYVLLLSANDFVLPGIFARARKCLARQPRPALWSAMVWLVDDADRTIRLHPSPVVALRDTYLAAERCARLAYRVGNWFTGPTLIYHRDTLRSVGGFDPAYGAPADFFTAVTIASLRGAAYSPEPCAGCRIHVGSYSSRALNEMGSIDATLAHVRKRGPELSPGLFTDKFCDRVAAHYHFAAVRASGGALLPQVAARQGARKRTALHVIERLIPRGLTSVRVALGFLILRPFDVLPGLWYRALAWMVVRAGIEVRGDKPPDSGRPGRR